MRLKVKQTTRNIKRLMKHTLYMRLVILLFCIISTVVLMQAGSLFLVDYIPISSHAIRKIYQQELFWNHQIDSAYSKSAGEFEVEMQHLESLPAADIGLELSWLQSRDDAEIYQAYTALEIAQIKLNQALTHHQLLDAQIKRMSNIVIAYENLAVALQRDVDTKQSVVSLLQLISLFFVICCLGAIGLGARKLLVDRLDALISFLPQELMNDDLHKSIDEFAELEQLVYIISARLEGFKAETQWFNQTSSERLRRMIRSQDFLYKFVASVNNTVLSETTLRKGLYQLEKALNVSNVALIFTESDAGVMSERVLFSQHKPAAIKLDLLEDLTSESFVRYFSPNIDGVNTQHLAVGFTTTSGALGVLKVEADADYLFDETETQLVEVTAELLSMIMGFQDREQEGRRMALLEERAAIARELHDSLAQSLAFMKIQISRLQSNSANTMSFDAIQTIVNELREGLDSAYKELRELLATFRVHMDVRGLNFAVQSAIDEFMQRSNLTITLDNRLVNCRLTVNEEFHVLHVIREALSNIVRHSGATIVNVVLILQPSGSVNVLIDDDGIGYAVASYPSASHSITQEETGHYGQNIMKERAYSLGGDISVLRRRKGGTRVRLVFTPKLPQ